MIIIEFIERTALNKGEWEKGALGKFKGFGDIFIPPNQRFELKICNIVNH